MNSYSSKNPLFWEAGVHIASFIAQVLTDLDQNGNGVPGSYFPDLGTVTPKQEADATLTWHVELEAKIAALERYVVQQRGGLTTPETVEQAKDALLWVAIHLQDLWD